MTEREEAEALAKKLLDRINADPDDDLAILSRQFLRATEAYRHIKDCLHRAEDRARVAEARLSELEDRSSGRPRCYCKPGKCMAPKIMGRQMPCLDPEKATAPTPSDRREGR